MIENQRHTTQIVAAYVRKNLIPTDQIASLINSVHSTLSGLGNDVVEEPPRVPAVSIRRSVHADYIVCIECGFKGKMLKGHLQSRHGLSVAQYKTRWKLLSDYPTTAPNYSERRSQFARSIGLGRRPGQSAAMPAPAPETTSEKPARRRVASKAAKARSSAKKTSPNTSAKKVSPTAKAKKASSGSSAKKASNRSRKPSSRAAKKVASVPEAATA